MTTDIMLPIGREQIQASASAKQEPEWLTQLRLDALEKAGQLELPQLEKTKLDRWNIDQYGQYKLEKAVQHYDELPASLKEVLQGKEYENLLVQQNASVIFEQLTEDLKSQGVIFMSLEEAAKVHENLVKPHLMSVVQRDENKVAALHAAGFSGGVFVYVPKNVEVQIPLQAMFLHDQKDTQFSPHILIVAEQHSRVTYVDYVHSEAEGANTVHNSVAEVVVKPGAHVTFASIHQLQEGTTDLSYRRAHVENDGKIEWIIGEMNNGNVVSDTTSILKGNGSNSDAKVICIGTKAQKLNITTRAVHFGKSSNSDMITRATMKDEATAIINGITKIEKGATHANGEQTERVLMLSPKARGDANPMLLIDEDEVTAGHAASAGQVNKEQLHYLMSRGISREQATKLIITGFLEPIVAEMPIPALKEQLAQLVERKLG
ncbi:Fe-S cluster assembly protein SufD [Marinicrinis sediminis]|uniref:Fe-S cluster assembly protein SufD n=1 Tax=Marinicrinis sediminis TaxID=1652465 RepID=A0ABW5R8N1_9BACL